jgi:hypothetical protein
MYHSKIKRLALVGGMIILLPFWFTAIIYLIVIAWFLKDMED